ncbi:MAG: SRPBCC family protein [Streptosporangiaceae bacterium]
MWAALTDPVLLARWLMPNDFRPVVGHAFTFRTDPVPQHGFDGVVHCAVLDLEPPQLLRFSWRSRDLDTVVSWSLVPEGTGTRLLITHDGFDDTDPAQRTIMGNLGGGWRGHLIRRLATLLGGDEA